MATVTYEAPGHPLVTLKEDGDDLIVVVGSLDANGNAVAGSGISGLSPKRTLTDEEQAFGITSLDPPAGRTSGNDQRVIDIAVRATVAAVNETLPLEPGNVAVLAQKVGHAVRGALAKLTRTDPSVVTIGSVFEPPPS